MMEPKLLLFAQGTADPMIGASLARALIESTQHKQGLNAEIVGIVSDIENGSARRVSELYGIRFLHLPPPCTDRGYRFVAASTNAEWFALVGWRLFVKGLDPRKTFNMHPGPIPLTRGKYDLDVHRAVIEAYKRGEIRQSHVLSHFVTEKMDAGPIFFQSHDINVYDTDTPESLQERAKQRERIVLPAIANLVIHEEIRWDGKDPKSLIVPPRYKLLPR